MRQRVRRNVSESVGHLCHLAREHAEAVDRQARFPAEVIEVARDRAIMSAYVPKSLGGGGWSLEELAYLCEAIGEQCAASAMVLAMHHSQVAALLKHGGNSSAQRIMVQDLNSRQLLVGSGTSETGAPDIRSSTCFIEQKNNLARLEKSCATLSYAAQSDAILVSARAAVDAPPGDQVFAFIRREQFMEFEVGTWHPMGMRGTCSPTVRFVATFAPDQVFPAPFCRILAETLVPVSHVLWASVWLGIARAASSKAQIVARRAILDRNEPAARYSLMAEIRAKIQLMEAQIDSAIRKVGSNTPIDGCGNDANFTSFEANAIKTNCSELAINICMDCLSVVGISGYMKDSSLSIERNIRDIISARVMIANSRITESNVHLMLI